MECLWSSEKGLTIKEILEYMSEKHHRAWKKQTLSTYISSLHKACLIRTDSSRKPYIYYACCTKDEFIHAKTRELVEEEYDNSLGRFIAAFAGTQKLSAEEAQDLRNLLDKLCPDEDGME